MEIINGLISIGTQLGVDVLIIISIVVIAQAIKVVFGCTKKWSFFFVMITGAVAGLSKIILENVSVTEWFRIIIGYPGVSILFYMLIKICLPKLKDKFFPSSEVINGK